MQTVIVATWLAAVSLGASGETPVYSAGDMGGYFREWLLCGPMALGENLSRTDYKHGKQCVGYHKDLLVSAGGEEMADPKAGDEVRYNGKTHRWFPYSSKGDLIPLDEIFSPNDLVVGYGFCRIHAAQAGRYILSIGSNDGVKVWLNGTLVHDHHPEMGRWLQRDDDYIPIRLHKGMNRLLVKIDEGSGDFGFVVRLLDYDKMVADIRKHIDGHKNLAVVSQDGEASVYFGQPYAISVLNPEGRVTVELWHETKGRLAVQSARPGFEITFPLRNIPDGLLTFKAVFPISDRESVRSERQHFKGKLSRHANVKMLRDLAMVDDQGKPYVPLGMYGVNQAAYKEVRQAGINFVTGSADDLDAARAAGLKVTIGLHGHGAEWIEKIKRVVKRNQNHPAVLCWMMFDEPGYNKADLLEMHKAYKLLYELDPVHPSYLVITTPTVYETFGRCCDVLALDTYPVSRGDYTSVPKSIAKAYDVSDGDQPVWHCGQTFAWPRDRVPTPAEHRYMTYAALIEGAKAFLWYAYQYRDFTLPKDDPALWKAHVRVLKELNDLTSLIVAPGRGKKVEVSGDRGLIRTTIKSDGKRRFLFAASDARDEPVRCTFHLSAAQARGEVAVYGEKRTLSIQDGKLTDTFEPLGVHIYELQQ